MRVVISLGGNALLRRSEAPEAQTQRHADPAFSAPSKPIGPHSLQSSPIASRAQRSTSAIECA